MHARTQTEFMCYTRRCTQSVLASLVFALQKLFEVQQNLIHGLHLTAHRIQEAEWEARQREVDAGCWNSCDEDSVNVFLINRKTLPQIGSVFPPSGMFMTARGERRVWLFFFWLISSSACLLMRYHESNDEWSDVELVQPIGQTVPYEFMLSKLWHSELDLGPDDRSHCTCSCLGWQISTFLSNSLFACCSCCHILCSPARRAKQERWIGVLHW